MKTEAKHTFVSKLAMAVLVMALLTPSFVKLAHAFSNHDHVICIDFQKTHLHEFDVECEFYKFKLNPQYSFDIESIELINLDHNFKIKVTPYDYLSQYQKLHFSLRGPPVLV